MASIKLFFICGIVFLLAGCSWIFPSHRPVVDNPDVIVEILNHDVLSAGGEVAFVPFVPGADAEAGAETDRLALLIVQGVSEAVNRAASSLKVSAGDDVSNTAFIFDGRIEEFSAKWGWKGLGYGRKDIRFRIKGEIRSRTTDEVVAVVYAKKVFRHMKEADKVAYQIGYQIGEELVK